MLNRPELDNDSTWNKPIISYLVGEAKGLDISAV